MNEMPHNVSPCFLTLGNATGAWISELCGFWPSYQDLDKKNQFGSNVACPQHVAQKALARCSVYPRQTFMLPFSGFESHFVSKS
jgi:hypothetical protein